MIASLRLRASALNPSPWMEAHRQLAEHAKQRTAVFQILAGQLDLMHSADEGADRDLRFHAREVGAEAEVDAAAEGEVAIVGACDVEAVGIGKARRIAVGGVQHRPDLAVLCDALAAKLD